MKKKRKICFVITDRAQYARNKLLLKLINEDSELDLHVIVGGAALLSKYGDVISDMVRNGFTSYDSLYTNVEGGDNISMAKTTGLAILEFTTSLQRHRPDIILIHGDRFEVLAAAIVAAYLNIIIGHIEGGDVSGTIDESVRHAVTKLSHIHFAANQSSMDRILKMGENPEHVHNTGSLDVEFLDHVPNISDLSFIDRFGVGAKINFNKPFIVVFQHPVTTGENNFKNIQITLQAINELGISAIWFWPNSDAGTSEMAHAIRNFREENSKYKIRFVTHIPPEKFINILKRASCIVGNSSAGIKESSYLGLPVVNIGTRQQNRLAAENVVHVGYDIEEIKKAVRIQLKHGHYPSSDIYFREDTSQRIVDILKRSNPPVQKKFFDFEHDQK